MNLPWILAIDLIDIIRNGIPVIFFVLWLIGQALSERQKQAKIPPRQQRPAPAQPKRATTEIEDEIDAFLRRAAEKKRQPQRQEPLAPREETVILVPPKREDAARSQPTNLPQTADSRRGDAAARSRGKSLGKPLSQRTATGREAPLPRPATASTVPPAPVRAGIGEGVLASTVRPLTSALSRQSSHLAEEVGLADEKMQSHLQSVFGHRVGRLQHVESGPAIQVKSSPIALSVVEMLKTPQGVQQMIVLNEILRRPEI